ncbi:alpha/beta-hydrolase [Cucurbitaria berberidis CBS 394.84]|uniref:Alpha/beta-hydrolase n=1 Tax=Cucurbitaria berberidis CBS 394.84 TaxID=1168544 RepID=A0A9P4GDU3_9PLEO|nr:alpha/beta-hydrolase [Cucurbitaria berberidis CBS 394.84]KAF1843691.1 alpha/beta-hydrolase [Cucurbitaria berberidis CBS 394.84]
MSSVSAHKKTAVYKETGRLQLKLDVTAPSSSAGPSTAVIHLHGGFLVAGDRTTFEPEWLIKACAARGWTYVTPDYRLLPEATGLDALSDVLAAYAWVVENVSTKVILAGSSAGGYLAVTAAAVLSSKPNPPLAVLSIYGISDFTSKRFITKGTPLMGEPSDNTAIIEKLSEAAKSGEVLTGSPFVFDPSDTRMGYIATLLQDALFPDYLTRSKGLAAEIESKGIQAIPEDQKVLFPVAVGLPKTYPPTVLLHGIDDHFVAYEQSQHLKQVLEKNGVTVHLEGVESADHGFDVHPDLKPAVLASLQTVLAKLDSIAKV